MAEALKFSTLLNKIQYGGTLSDEEKREFLSLWTILFGSFFNKKPQNPVEVLQLLAVED